MLRVWLNSPIQPICCPRSCRRRRKDCLVIRNIHVLVLFVVLVGLIFVLVWQPAPQAATDRNAIQEKGLKMVHAVQEHDSLTTRGIPTLFPGQALPKRVVGPDPQTKNPTTLPGLQLPVDWQKTQLGPGFPSVIDSAWSELGVLKTGSVLRIEADGYNAKNHPNAGWGWYINIWSGDGRHWVDHPEPEPSRLLHVNPRPRGGMIAMNHFLRGSGWGTQVDVPIPEAWTLGNAGKPFVLELELGSKVWSFKLNGQLQPAMKYHLKGDYYEPLILQLYDVINPKVFLALPAPDPVWKTLPLDWHKTQLGPGYTSIIDSAWTDLGVLTTGTSLRVQADGYNGKDHPNAVWGWYLNVWNEDGRHWTDHPEPEPSRLLHFNPRPRGGMIAINLFLRGSGWGAEKDAPVPSAWKLENAAKPFVLEVKLGMKIWSIKLNGEPQPGMAYERKGDYSKPLTLQLYDVLNPRVSLRNYWKEVHVDWQKTQLGPGYPSIIDSAWSDLGVLCTGTIVRVEAGGFNGKEHANADWGWYLNMWNGDGRHWVEHVSDTSRLLHLNPRPRGGNIAMNHCLKGAWGSQKDVPIPGPWKLENSKKPFVLELELGPKQWSMRLNGKLQPGMTYDRKGDFSKPLVLQLYDVVEPRVSIN